MSVTIESTGPCRKRLRIEVAAERVAGVRAEIIQELRRVANVPGFRPGKAPEPMVEKRYAKEIEDEVRKRVVPDAYREAVVEQKLRVVGYPQIESVENFPGRPMTYVALVDTAPEFELPDYKGIPVKKPDAAVGEESVRRALEGLRDQQADFVDVTGRGTQNGDFAVIDYSGVVDGKPVAELAGEARTLGENKGFWVLVGPDSFLPGFCEQLLGARVGEKRQVLVDFPVEFPERPLAGRKATYFVTVTGIKEKKLPELNDEFAKKLGMESVAKLEEEVRNGLVGEAESRAQSEMRRQVVEYLLGRVQFELPESLVAQETRSIIYEVVRENSLRGVTKEQLEEKKDEIFGHATRSARERLRSSFILEAIAEAEKIKVEPAEIEERIARMAEGYRVTPERLKAQLTERGGLGELEEQILVGKTLDFLIANAKVEPTKE
jgi:trigger factor